MSNLPYVKSIRSSPNKPAHSGSVCKSAYCITARQFRRILKKAGFKIEGLSKEQFNDLLVM